jgi:hypothetical protein
MGIRKRLTAVLLLASLIASISVALEAPAIALEFPHTIARALHLDERDPGVVALPLRATHLAFSWEGSDGTGIAFRIGVGGRWQRAPEAHDARRAAQHFSAVLSTDRPAAVEWRPIVPKGGWIDDVVLDAINTEDGPKFAVEVPRLAHGAPRAPQVVTRAEWGADESLKSTSGSCRRTFFDVQQLFVHHTAGRNNDPKPKATMRAILWYHAVRQGWCDIGYNFVIGSDGRVYEGRWARSYKPWELHSSEDVHRRAVAGAHVAGFNSGTVGISLMGNFQIAPVPQPMRRTLAELLGWEADRHGLKPTGTHTYRNPTTGLRKRLPYIAGHRDAGDTDCPGRYLYRALPGIREDANAVIGGGKTVTSTTLSVPEHTSYGDSVAISGRLLDENGAALVAQPVILYAKESGAPWRVEATPTSGLDGSFAHSFSAEESLRLSAVYEGDETMWGSQSETSRLGVRPDITFVAEGATADIFGTYRFPAGTSVVVLSGTVSPAHPGHSVVVKVGVPQEDGSISYVDKREVAIDTSGGYRYEFPVPSPGPYTGSCVRAEPPGRLRRRRVTVY